MHDARILRSSEFFWRAERRKILDEPCKVINGHRLRPPILRDGTYPILPMVDEAFSQCTTTCSPQLRFYGVLSSPHRRVEYALGVLKAPCRILLKRLDSQFDNVPRSFNLLCFAQLASDCQWRKSAWGGFTCVAFGAKFKVGPSGMTLANKTRQLKTICEWTSQLLLFVFL